MQHYNIVNVLKSIRADSTENEKVWTILNQAVRDIENVIILESEAPSLNLDEEKMIENHKMVNAIKSYRNRTGCSLYVSKLKCDEYARG